MFCIEYYSMFLYLQDFHLSMHIFIFTDPLSVSLRNVRLLSLGIHIQPGTTAINKHSSKRGNVLACSMLIYYTIAEFTLSLANCHRYFIFGMANWQRNAVAHQIFMAREMPAEGPDDPALL